MPRDLPDWGALSSQATVYEITDLGELAVRLGSIVTFDRRGDVTFLDSFNDGMIHWTLNPNGAGADAGLSMLRSRNGRFSALLTAGSDGLGSMGIVHIMPFAVLSGLGVEFSFNIPSTITELRLAVALYDGSNLTRYLIRWEVATLVLEYLDSGGSWVTFATGVDFHPSASLFHTWKLVFDATDSEYARLIYGPNAAVLNDIAAEVSASAELPRIETEITVYGAAAANDQIYIDDVIQTQNEPV